MAASGWTHSTHSTHTHSFFWRQKFPRTNSACDMHETSAHTHAMQLPSSQSCAIVNLVGLPEMNNDRFGMKIQLRRWRLARKEQKLHCQISDISKTFSPDLTSNFSKKQTDQLSLKHQLTTSRKSLSWQYKQQCKPMRRTPAFQVSQCPERCDAALPSLADDFPWARRLPINGGPETWSGSDGDVPSSASQTGSVTCRRRAHTQTLSPVQRGFENTTYRSVVK